MGVLRLFFVAVFATHPFIGSERKFYVIGKPDRIKYS